MHPRDAATVILLRDGCDSLEVCLLRRTSAAVFAGGAHVFPGGAVDDADHDLAGHPAVGQRNDVDASLALGVERDGLAYWVAAVRECFEEAGVLLARQADGRPLDFESASVADRFNEHRRAMQAGRLSLIGLCQLESLVLDLDQMFYLSHWITPPGAPRRFDTRFFVAPTPAGQCVVPDQSEVVADLWCTPRQALAAEADGRLDLILPTARSLAVLGRFGQVDEVLSALAAAEARDHEHGPTLVDDAGGRRRQLPGDAVDASRVVEAGPSSAPNSCGVS